MRDQQLLLAAVACLITSFALALSTAPTGYEISIYDSLSPGFWIALVGAFVFFSAGLFRTSVKSRGAYKAANLFGLAILHLFMVGLPALRYGTYYTGADVWFQLGQASSIARTGHVDLASNIYPSLHFAWVTIAQMTGTSVYAVGQLLGALIEALRIPLVFVLVSRLFRNPRVAAFAAPLSVVPDGITGVYPAPWSYSIILLLMLALVLLIRTCLPGMPSAILTVAAATSFTVSHPLGPIFLATAFAFVAVWSTKRKPESESKEGEASNHDRKRLAGPAIYVAVIYFAWIGMLTLILETSVSKLAEALGAEGVVSPMVYGRFFTVILVLKIYGAYALLGVYWLAGLLILLRRPHIYAVDDARLVVCLIWSGVIIGLAFESIASPALLGDFIQRPFDIVILFLPILGGLFLARLDRFFKSEVRKTAVVYGAIAVPFLLATAAMYPSPFIALSNNQNTQQLYSSIDWVAVNLPNDVSVLSNSYVGRYAYYPMLSGDDRYAKLYHTQDTLPASLIQLDSLSDKRTYMMLDKETIVVAAMDLRAWSFPSPQAELVIREKLETELIYDNGEAQVYLL